MPGVALRRLHRAPLGRPKPWSCAGPVPLPPEAFEPLGAGGGRLLTAACFPKLRRRFSRKEMDINKLPSEDQTASSRWPRGPRTPSPVALPQPPPPRLPGSVRGLRREEGDCRGHGVQARDCRRPPSQGHAHQDTQSHRKCWPSRAGIPLPVLRTWWPSGVGSDPVTTPGRLAQTRLASAKAAHLASLLRGPWPEHTASPVTPI